MGHSDKENVYTIFEAKCIWEKQPISMTLGLFDDSQGCFVSSEAVTSLV